MNTVHFVVLFLLFLSKSRFYCETHYIF